MILPSHHTPCSQGPWQIGLVWSTLGQRREATKLRMCHAGVLSSVDTEVALSLGPRNLQQGRYRKAHCPRKSQGQRGCTERHPGLTSTAGCEPHKAEVMQTGSSSPQKAGIGGPRVGGGCPGKSLATPSPLVAEGPQVWGVSGLRGLKRCRIPRSRGAGTEPSYPSQSFLLPETAPYSPRCQSRLKTKDQAYPKGSLWQPRKWKGQFLPLHPKAAAILEPASLSSAQSSWGSSLQGGLESSNA